VVEDDVQDHLQPGPVKRLDHVAELVEGSEPVRSRAVRLVRREQGDRRVAPVVDPARGGVLGIELKHGQELDRRDAQVLEVGDLLDQPGVGPGLVGRDPRAGRLGEAADVQLVDDRLAMRPPERVVPFPVVGR
jgi:hypothetical protein